MGHSKWLSIHILYSSEYQFLQDYTDSPHIVSFKAFAAKTATMVDTGIAIVVIVRTKTPVSIADATTLAISSDIAIVVAPVQTADTFVVTNSK